MGISIDKASRKEFIFLSMILMLVSLFTSRFLLSVSFILFLFLTCFHKEFLEQLHSFITNPFLVGISLLFFIPFATWFWTEDKTMWVRFVRIKLPLLLFPLAFAGKWQLSPRQWRWIAYTFLAFVFVGSCWSLWQYFQNIHLFHEQYLKAKLIPTPLENDHVRFSLLVALAIVCLVLLMKQDVSKTRRLLGAILLVFFIAFLHVLSARTGLIAFYIFVLFVIVYLTLKSKQLKWVIGLSILIVGLPVAAWFLFPSFQNRLRYNRYDLSNAKENKYVPGSNDGKRILSLKAGWNVLQQHPFGVGGDVVDKTYEWYDANVPAMNEEEKLFPSSEPLMYAGFAGWIGLLLFTAAMLLSFFEPVKNDYFFWFTLNALMAFSFLFDIGLEAQFGVFIYAFIVLWWWKWLGRPETNIRSYNFSI
ncbi:MAG TPA: O-antigen ligase family protein [Flavisolibacter sp.]